ncbi:hypothetical protein D3C72_2294160 [compost metagenome]
MVRDQPFLAAAIFGALWIGGTIGSEIGIAFARHLDEAFMVHMAGGGDHHVVAHIVAAHIFAHRLGGKGAH